MFGGKLFFLYELKEAALHWQVVRWVYAHVFIMKARMAERKNEIFQAVSFALKVDREISAVEGAASPSVVSEFLHKYLEGNKERWSDLLVSYRQSELARWHRRKYCSFELTDRLRIRQPRNPSPPERQGALFILKPNLGPKEKGVLLLNYDETIDTFFALFDLEKLAHDYRIVVEPSAWGYQQPRIHLLRGLDTDVVVQSQYKPDFEYIKSLGGALHPIRLGAGDWADPELFCSGYMEEKHYDLVMIANWLKWKRHKLLFQAMRNLGARIGRVALIGYPLEGRTSDEIRALAQKFEVAEKIDIFENVSMSEVSNILRRAKVGVLLSKKEGANRGIYECFFSDVPVILTNSNIGVNRDHLNEQTGKLVSDKDLPIVIEKMIQEVKRYKPRDWAIKNTGCTHSSKALNTFIRNIALAQYEEWTCDIFPKKNIPVPFYLNSDPIAIADREIAKLENYLLPEAR